MDKTRRINTAFGEPGRTCQRMLSTVFALLVLSSCAPADIKRDVRIPEEKSAQDVRPQIAHPLPEPPTPDFVSVTEELSPLKTKIVDVVARNTPLRDVLHVIAEATNLNLVIEKGVVEIYPVTLTLKNVSAEDALNIIFSSVDCFYTVRENLLIVKAVDTRIFELGHPTMTQNYTSSVGGSAASRQQGANNQQDTNSKDDRPSATTQGSITQSGHTSVDFWGSLEKSINQILKLNPVEDITQSVNINRMTGTIVVTATRKNMDMVEKYIETIRKVINRQVLVEAKIIEVQLTDNSQFGINWGFLDTWKGIGKVNMNSSTLSSTPNFSIGLTGLNFTSILNALSQQGEVRTLSNPRINIMNGNTAFLSVGRNYSFISGTKSSTTNNNSNTAAASATTQYTVSTDTIHSGIMIGIVPYINENNEISLTITPIISDLVKLEDKVVGKTGTDQLQITLPTIDLKELTTTVKVKDGQMIIIGGLITKKESVQKSKVPVASDLPLVGGLFNSHENVESKSEMVVILQTIVSR